MSGETITITKAEYDEFETVSQMYHALIAAGVKNWDGYEVAQDIRDSWNE